MAETGGDPLLGGVGVGLARGRVGRMSGVTNGLLQRVNAPYQ
jgi:hypothetical protein